MKALGYLPGRHVTFSKHHQYFLLVLSERALKVSQQNTNLRSDSLIFRCLSKYYTKKSLLSIPEWPGQRFTSDRPGPLPVTCTPVSFPALCPSIFVWLRSPYCRHSTSLKYHGLFCIQDGGYCFAYYTFKYVRIPFDLFHDLFQFLYPKTGLGPPSGPPFPLPLHCRLRRRRALSGPPCRACSALTDNGNIQR